MKIRHIVLICLIISFSAMLIILIAGLLIPESTLNSMSNWLANKTELISNNSTNTINSNTVVPSNTTNTNTTPTPTPTPANNTTPQNNTTPPAAPKCNGNTPCYGPSTMAAHSASGDCWSYQTYGGTSVIYNMTAFNDVHSAGPKEQILAGCGKAIDWSSVPSNSKHSAAQSNSQRIFLQFKVGYYDASA